MKVRTSRDRRRLAGWGLSFALLVYLRASIHWLLVGPYLVTLAKILALLFLPALGAGFVYGLVRRETGYSRCRLPGWGWYALVEVAATFTKLYPFFWGNVLHMVSATPRPWLSIPLGGLLGIYCLRGAGRASERGYRAAGWVAGFGRALPPSRPAGWRRRGPNAAPASGSA